MPIVGTECERESRLIRKQTGVNMELTEYHGRFSVPQNNE